MDNTDTNIPSPEDRYKIILTGKILPGKNPDEVKQNLASIFKMTTTDIEQKISGKTVVVKSGIDLPTANKYMAALEKAGVECKSIPDKPSNATAPETDPSDNDTNPKKDQENITKDPSLKLPRKNKLKQKNRPRNQADTGSFRLHRNLLCSSSHPIHAGH